MTPCDRIRAQAVALSALDPSDPERREAEDHARTCANCGAALEEGAGVVAALDALPDPEAPTTMALAIAHDAVEAAWEPGWRRFVLPAQLTLGFVVLSTVVPTAAGPRPLAALVLLGAAVALAFARGPLVTWAALGASMGAALALGGGTEGLRLDHASCFLLEAAAAALPLATTAWLLSRGEVDEMALPAASASGALAGQAAMVLVCAHTSYGHLFVYHVGAVALAAGIGLVLARTLRPSER